MIYHFKKKHGFTLIEIIVTIVILSIIMAISAEVIVNVLDSWRISVFRKNLLFSGRMSINRMVHEIRQFSRSSFKHIDSERIEGSGHFTRDLQTGGVVTDPNTLQILSFFLDGTKLMRYSKNLSGDSNDILACNVQSLHFTYWDANGTSTDDPNNNIDISHEIKRIRFMLGFQQENQTFNIESGITLRNQK